MSSPPPAPRAQRALGRAAAGAAVAALLAGAACEERESWIERRRHRFEAVAALVNGPFAELHPLDAEIAEQGGEGVLLLDARWDACLKAAPVAASVERLAFPPDEQGKPIEVVEALRQAAGRFKDGIQKCGGEQGGGGRPAADPQCIARCTRSWSALAQAAEKVRLEADWVGVRVNPVGPPSDPPR